MRPQYFIMSWSDLDVEKSITFTSLRLSILIPLGEILNPSI
jgi:hypothetical protein